jgi:hypothetical protein
MWGIVVAELNNLYQKYFTHQISIEIFLYQYINNNSYTTSHAVCGGSLKLNMIIADLTRLICDANMLYIVSTISQEMLYYRIYILVVHLMYRPLNNNFQINVFST